MVRTGALFALGACLALAQDHQSHVMGFSMEKTTHHFELRKDGGLIEVRADDANDTKSRDEIRGHFQHIRQMFSKGDFNVPMLVHERDVPGTAAMSRLKADLHWDLEQTDQGARIVIKADNKAAREALYEFLRFQIADHKTGDCTSVRW